MKTALKSAKYFKSYKRTLVGNHFFSYYLKITKTYWSFLHIGINLLSFKVKTGETCLKSCNLNKNDAKLVHYMKIINV